MCNLSRWTPLCATFAFLACGGSDAPSHDAAAPDARFLDDAVAPTDSAVVSLDGAVEQSCQEVACDGGDLNGAWQLAAFCLSVAPQMQECGEIASSYEIDAEGEIQFSSDQTFSRNITISSVIATTSYPPGCIPKEIVSCQAWSESQRADCSGDIATGCTCVESNQETNRQVDTGTWISDGKDLTLTLDGNNPKDPDIENLTFCVTGAELYVENSILGTISLLTNWTRATP